MTLSPSIRGQVIHRLLKELRIFIFYAKALGIYDSLAFWISDYQNKCQAKDQGIPISI